MELINVRDDDRMSDFYGAARRGDVQTLVQLLRRDASILANIPDGLQTPLHISALLGHFPFTVALLNHDRECCNLAIRGDSSGRTALHLASAEGHLDIVRELLHVNNKTCLNRDKEGRTPLHYAAMRGRTEVVQELIMARPESLGLGDGEQNNVFHLCVTYNHLQTLKILVKLDYATANVTADQRYGTIFTYPDRVGNTILHLAIMFKRVEVVWYLLSVPEIRELEKAQNRAGLTAHDILQCSSKDLKMDEIKLIMLTKEDDGDTEESKALMSSKRIQNCLMKILKWIGIRLRRGVNTDWLEEMRGNLSEASIFISSVTFQALINPPGGFIQQGSSSQDDSNLSYLALNCTTLQDNLEYCPGEAVSFFGHQDNFSLYLNFITLSFYASICVTLLLVSGVPLKNSAAIWILSILMSFTLLFLALAYNTAAKIVTPKHLSLTIIGDAALGVWSMLLVLVVVFYSLGFIIWIARKCYQIISKLIRCCS